MKIKVIDFEFVTRHYKTYREGMELIEIQKKLLLDSIAPLKKEIQDSMMSNAQASVYDRKIREQRSQNFENLQKRAVELEASFSQTCKDIVNNTNTKTFDELEVIVREWAIENNIDLVTSKMETIYNRPEIEATQDILEVLKSRGLYVDYNPEEKKPIQVFDADDIKEN